MGGWCITQIIYIIYIVKNLPGWAQAVRDIRAAATSGAWDTGAPEDERA